MQTEQVMDITRQALKVAILMSCPLILFGLVTGILINVFQAVTQLSESTLAIVPKLLMMILALVLFAPWMIDLISDFTIQIFESIPSSIR